MSDSVGPNTSEDSMNPISPPLDPRRRLAFLDMGPQDAERLRGMLEAFRDWADDFVEVFYRHLLSFDDTARFLQAPETVRWLKGVQREHFETMLEARWDEDYVERRRKVGLAHAGIGLEPQYFLGAYNQYVQYSFEQLAQAHTGDVEGYKNEILSLLKAIFFDIGLTLDEYDRMIERAVFERDRRIELIHGELREMSPIGDPHRDAVNVLTNDWFAAQSTAELRAKVTVQVQCPIRLPAQASAPISDMSWIAKRTAGAVSGDGDEVFLVIEVADTSLDKDRGEKAQLYAEAEIPDYWIVNLVDLCVEVCRDPRSGHYQSLATYHAGDEIRPLLFADYPLQLGLLF